MLRILVVDDHEVVRRGVISLLQNQPDFQIVGEASNGFEAVAMAERLQPDVIVLDISLPGLNGLDAARQIRRVSPSSQVLFFSQHNAPEMVTEAMRIGGAGYVCKADAGRELVSAVLLLSMNASCVPVVRVDLNCWRKSVCFLALCRLPL